MPALRLLILTLTLAADSLYAGVPAALKNENVCGKEVAKFETATVSECVRSLCVNALQIKARICACLKNEDTGEVKLSILRGDETVVASSSTQVMPPTFEPHSLRLEVGNYAGDGSAQLLLAVKNSYGNGMEVEGWSVMRVNAHGFAPPLDVSDYGVMSFTTAARSGGRCRMLSSSWTAGSDPKRGEGLYIVGSWYDLGVEGFSPTDKRPILSHRYLYSLENERAKSKYAAEAKPVYWYKSPNASVVVGADPRQ
jgi:hypothetical protein